MRARVVNCQSAKVAIANPRKRERRAARLSRSRSSLSLAPGDSADLRARDLSLSRSSLLSLSPGDSAALLSRSLSADDDMVARM